jgi:hypothetical protein
MPSRAATEELTPADPCTEVTAWLAAMMVGASKATKYRTRSRHANEIDMLGQQALQVSPAESVCRKERAG